MALPANAVEVDLREGRARMSARSLRMQDYFDIPNALFRFEDPVSTPATCSFDIHWSGPVTSRGPVTGVSPPGPPGSPSPTGHLLLNQATMTWSASNSKGFRFQSHRHNTTSVFAQLGHVQNGVFA
jgi:hypothetical protein